MRQEVQSCFLLVLMSGLSVAANGPLLPQLPGSQLLIANTIPPTGDVNPYGVAFVPAGFAPGGILSGGEILVSNFNNSANQQGTGNTIVSISPDGTNQVFFRGPRGLGLSTALGVLPQGVIVVGNVPTTDGTCPSIQSSSLLFLDRYATPIATLVSPDLLNGPWDLAVNATASATQVFVSNVLSGAVERLNLLVSADGKKVTLQSATQIASGYAHRCDPNALVVGPTGLAYDAKQHILYVASTGDNAIYAINNADATTSDNGKGTLLYSDDAHLRAPLGLILVPNGNLITTNGDAINGDPTHPSEMIEFTPAGQFVAALSADTNGQGGAFGLASTSPASSSDATFRLAAVDDVNNTLKIWTVR